MDIKRKILCSCDDGYNLDLTLSSLLRKYRIPAVFYIAPNYYRFGLSNDQMRYLAGVENGLFEIGAHTMNHPYDLKRLSEKELVSEISGSKVYLEDIIKKPVTKFCYPRGRFDERVKQVVREAGFKEARTTRVLNIDFPKDLFETDTSIHIYPDRKEYKGRTWIEIGYELFDKVIKDGGRFEIFCHSFEIEKYNLWESVNDFLQYMDDGMKKINYLRKI